MKDYTDSLRYYFKSNIRKDGPNYIVEDAVGECIEVILEEKTIYVVSLNKCELNGTTVIEHIVLFANRNDFKEIMLGDESYISLDLNGFPFKVDLAALNILATGKSWYNRLGFRQDNYEDNIERWRLIRDLTFRDLYNEIVNLDSNENNFITKNYYNSPFYAILGYEPLTKADKLEECINIMHSIIPEYIDVKVKDASANIMSTVRSDDYKRDERIRAKLAYIGFLSYILNYDREDLIYVV